jgi:hypothetical protein
VGRDGFSGDEEEKLENKKPRFRWEAGRRQILLFRCVQAVCGLVLLPWFRFPAAAIIPW